MRLARVRTKPVEPEPNRHVSSTQRRRERRDKRREDQANQRLKTQRCSVSRMPLQHVDLVYASLRLSLRSLRLCVEFASTEWR